MGFGDLFGPLSNFRFFYARNASQQTKITYFNHGAWLGLGFYDSSIYPMADNLLYKLISKGWVSREYFSINQE